MSDELQKIHAALTVPVPVAGRMLGIVSRNTAYRAARAGDIPTIRIGKRLVVPTAKLRDMLGIADRQTA